MKKFSLPDQAKSIQWLNEALSLAREAGALDEVPVGAVIIRDGKIVGRGYNRRERDHNPVSHAEIEAILQATRTLGDWRLSGCTLYVTLEPCPMCLAASQQARLDAVVYGAVDPKGGALSLGYKLHEDLRINHRFPVTLEELSECGQVLKAFFAAKRDKNS